MANRIKGITIEINGETTGLDKALKSVNSTIKTTQSELRDVTKLLKLDPTNTELVKQKQELLAKAVSETKTKLDALKKAAQQMGEITENSTEEEISQYNALQREISDTESKLKSLTTQQKNFAAQHSALGELSAKFQTVGSKISDVGTKLTAVSAAAAAVVTALGGITVKAAAAADDLNTLSKKTGISTNELQKFQYASELIDVSLTDISKGLARTTKAISSNSDVLSELNIKVKNANGTYRDTNDVFFDIIDALNSMEDETQRDIYAQELFGKSFQNLNPLIEDGTDKLRELYKQAESSDLLLSQEEIDNANELNDSIDTLKSTWELAMNKMGAALSKDLQPYVDKLTEKLEDISKWAEEHSGAATTIATVAAITAVLAPLLIVIGKVIEACGTIGSFVAKLPGLTSIFTTVGSAISSVWESIQLAVWGAGESLAGTATSIAGAFGVVAGVVTSVITIIGTFVWVIKEMVENWDKVCEEWKKGWEETLGNIKAEWEEFCNEVKEILSWFGFDVGEVTETTATRAEERAARMSENVSQSGINAINGMKTGIASGKSGVISEVNDVATQSENRISSLNSNSYGWGADMMNGMKSGIDNNSGGVISKIESLASRIKSLIHFSRPDTGPLHDYEKWMPDFMQGLAKGINENVGLIDSAMGNVANSMNGNIQMAVTHSVQMSNQNSMAESIVNGILNGLSKVTLDNQLVIDRQTVARAFTPLINSQLSRTQTLSARGV